MTTATRTAAAWTCALAMALGLAGGADAGAYRKNFSSKPWQMDQKYEMREVGLRTEEPPGTIIISTRKRFLFLVLGEGKALRYGIGVGRMGFTWS